MTATIRPREGYGSLAHEVHGLNHDAHAYKPAKGAQPGALPKDAAAFLADLDATAADLNVVSNATFERLQHEREDRALLKNQIHEMEQNHPDKVDGDKEYERARKLVVAHDERIAETTARWERQAAAWKATAQLVRAIVEWRGAHADAIIVTWDRPLPRTGKGETAAQAVDRCRARVAELRAEVRRIERAPLPSADVKAGARAYVAGLAVTGRPDVGGMMQGDRAPAFSLIPAVMAHKVQFGSIATAYEGGPVNDGLALMAWAHPEVLIAALDREIDAVADDARAMTAAAKSKALAEAGDAILAAERDEEAFLRMAAATGPAIERRADADPRAVLQVMVASEVVQ